MNIIARLEHGLFLATALLAGAMVTPAATATPFSAQVMAGFAPDALVTVGRLDFEVAQGDGSVRPFDFGRALGDGSVRKSGDGSVRTCDGSVMPAGGACDAAVNIGTFDFSGTFDIDPSLAFVLSVTNNHSSSVMYSFTFMSPFGGGPYDTLATGLSGTGDASGIGLDGLVDGSVVPAANISCSSPAVCADPVVSLATATNATGLFGARLLSTVPAGSTAPTTAMFNGSAVLSQANGRPLPEPASLALCGVGLCGVGLARRRRRI